MRNFVWGVIKRFLFLLDAETAHELTLLAIRFGIRLGNFPLRVASGGTPEERQKSLIVFGFPFLSPIGLAAGFDKDAEIVPGMPHLGFGFTEIGTVTPRPQPGNERPRLFRDPSRQLIFNRMGFNGKGALHAAENLRIAREDLPEYFRVGVNLGKNKDTPLDQAHLDYALAAKPFEGLADYVVINVSSPNTPGLRTLQSFDSLKPIIEEVGGVLSRWQKTPPLLLKLAPELEEEALQELIPSAEKLGIRGWIFTNTLAGSFQARGKVWTGGQSGAPLTRISRQSLFLARRLTRLPIISVGGVLTENEAIERKRCGADLIQVYAGWVFHGPGFPRALAQAWRE